MRRYFTLTLMKVTEDHKGGALGTNYPEHALADLGSPSFSNMRSVEVGAMEEEWRDIPGYEGYYQASSLGRVRSLDRVVTCYRWGSRRIKGKVMKPKIDIGGYEKIGLCRNSKYSDRPVHNLVGLCFIGPRIKGYVYDHIDGDRRNNKLSNIQLITCRENALKGRMCILKPDKKSKYAGVVWDAGKWIARARYKGKRVNIARCASEEEAGKRYKDFVSEIMRQSDEGK